ncbi:MAG: hypothetical protein IIB54_08580 [Planctomycetes bacterium]|nr:hypothetical protein [Planctomycetota bacterium]
MLFVSGGSAYLKPVLALSGQVDDATAARICEGKKFLEVIIAPGYDDTALKLLSDRWKNVRLLAVGALGHSPGSRMDYKSVPGGMLLQERDLKPARVSDWKHAAGPAPTEQLIREAGFIWTLAKHLKSNAIAIGTGNQMLGAGMGQVDRINACNLAIERAGKKIKASPTPVIAASDAFFPFSDGPQLLIDAGVKCLVHPGGSKRDQDTFDLCDKYDVTCLLTGTRHFRH